MAHSASEATTETRKTKLNISYYYINALRLSAILARIKPDPTVSFFHPFDSTTQAMFDHWVLDTRSIEGLYHPLCVV